MFSKLPEAELQHVQPPEILYGLDKSPMAGRLHGEQGGRGPSHLQLPPSETFGVGPWSPSEAETLIFPHRRQTDEPPMMVMTSMSKTKDTTPQFPSFRRPWLACGKT